MSYTALPVIVPGNVAKATSHAIAIRNQLIGLGALHPLGYLNTSRGYRALSTSYVLPDDYGRVPINWDVIGSGWDVFALFEVICDDAAGTVRVEIVNLSGLSNVAESAIANPTTWTLQTALVIPETTGTQYYTARIKGGNAAMGVGMVGGIYLAAP